MEGERARILYAEGSATIMHREPRAGLQTIMEMYARDAECSMSDCGGGNNEGGVSRLALQLVHMRVHIVLWGSCLLLG